MKRLSTLLVLSIIGATQALWAIPSTINYQGTLKEKGLPASGTKTISFQITDGTGNQPYSDKIDKTVTVTNGLFSTQLDFKLKPTYTWETITPFIQVSIGGQVLTPAEPINATVYATVSSSIVDGAITPAKVAPGYGLVPSGAIMMFATSCPSSWIRFSALDGFFPLGSNTYGTTGGSATHDHSISIDGAHTHTTPQTCNSEKCNVSLGTSNAEYNPNTSGWVPQTPAMTTSMAGNHNHGGATGSASNMPPYLSMLFCQKQ